MQSAGGLFAIARLSFTFFLACVGLEGSALVTMCFLDLWRQKMFILALKVCRYAGSPAGVGISGASVDSNDAQSVTKKIKVICFEFTMWCMVAAI